MVESGLWAGGWYPGWIETDITMGSAINLLSEIAYVNGTKTLVVGARAIECWEVPLLMYGIPYIFWYDKVSGLWIGMHMTSSLGEYADLLLDTTNVPIGILYEHDLGVSLDAPARVQPNATVMLNATVHNVGLNNETNVTVQLIVNGTAVKSEALPTLPNGTSYTMNCTWTPAAEGFYNVTAYAPPVPAENVTANNAETRMAQVQYIEVALISDYSELVSITPALNEMGLGYDLYSNNMMNLYTENLTLMLGYKVVCFYKDGRSITSNEYTALDAYLRAKGCLLVTGWYSLNGDTLLADIVRSSTNGDDSGETDLYVADATHPIVNGPYGVFPQNYHVGWLSAECSLAEANTARGAVTVAELADGYDRIIATERIPGKVVFWNGVGTSDWEWSSDCEAMFKNIIHWFTFRYDHELAVSLTAPEFLEPSNSTTLRATVENLGLSNETDVEVQILINGTVVKNGTTALLPSDGTYAITHSWTAAAAGTYNITGYAAPVAGENNTVNNVYSQLVPVQIAQRILSYVLYADYLGSYRNTLAAMESAFGPAYKVTEFWVHTQLASMLPGRDILLVPNQEQANLGIMTSIGADWSETLADFLNTGGTVIICDGGTGAGETYGILAGAGLVSISAVYSRTNYTLYLTEPSDRLAEGVSPTFSGPYRTTSYQTLEEKVVITDGTYPVVIHKYVGGGHLVLLGFDYEDYGADAAQLLGNAVALTAYVTVSISPTGGAPGTEVLVTGAGATVNGSVSIYWDTTLIANTMANGTGGFSCTLVVPEDAAAGTHEIRALDVASGKSASAFFKVIYALLNPNRGPVGTKVTVHGMGFGSQSQASVTYNDILIGYATVNLNGEFSFTFNIPASTPETQIVKTLDEEGNYAHALFTVVDVTPLDVQVDVGAIHFTWETAEFYVLTALKGEAVNVTVANALLYKPDGTTETLIVQPIATGLYKIPYTIVDSTAGTYTLVMTATYETESAQANGTAFKSFLLSSTLVGWNAALVSIGADVATIKTDTGLFNVKLDAINATITNIDERTVTISSTLGLIRADMDTVNAMLTALNGTAATIHTDLGEVATSIDNIGFKVVSINGTAVTIETVLGTLNGTITSIVNNMASIQTDIGEVQADISDFRGTQQAWVIPQYLILVMAVIAAATSATVLLIFLLRRKAPEQKSQ
jgi:archaellum component FlaF (FlaF/FlaG flagellin family)